MVPFGCPTNFEWGKKFMDWMKEDIKANDGLKGRKSWKGTIHEGYQIDKGRNNWQISLWISSSWGISRFTEKSQENKLYKV